MKLKALTAAVLATALLSACGSSAASSAAPAADTSSETAASADNSGDLLAQIQQRGEIVFGTEGTWSPWTYHDENDQLVGFDIEVAQKVAEKLGVKATFVEGEWDGLLAGGIAVLICWMERYLSPFCMNGVEFQFIASFLSGVSTLLLCRFGMQFHADKVLIGSIMLLIPGIMLTNSIRDILLGDIISGSLRLVEAILMAATLALGMMAAIWLMGGISA